MAPKEERSEGNLTDVALSRIREKYVEEHGEQPPEEFMKDARQWILKEVAKRNRDAHRDIYDALAKE